MVCRSVRGNARIIGFGVLAAVIGGVLPDAISHGVILTGREGHGALAIIGAFLILSGLLWYGLSIALDRRLSITRKRAMAMVDDGLKDIAYPDEPVYGEWE